MSGADSHDFIFFPIAHPNLLRQIYSYLWDVPQLMLVVGPPHIAIIEIGAGDDMLEPATYLLDSLPTKIIWRNRSGFLSLLVVSQPQLSLLVAPLPVQLPMLGQINREVMPTFNPDYLLLWLNIRFQKWKFSSGCVGVHSSIIS